jgi:hypothetical protein
MGQSIRDILFYKKFYDNNTKPKISFKAVNQQYRTIIALTLTNQLENIVVIIIIHQNNLIIITIPIKM